jgi:hypothetical protein
MNVLNSKKIFIKAENFIMQSVKYFIINYTAPA